MAVKLITVAREFGSEIDFIFERLAKEYSFLYIDRNYLFPSLCKYLKKSPEDLILWERKLEEDIDKDFSEEYKRGIKRIVEESLEKVPVILMGRGGQILFSNFPDSLHINIIAPINIRVQNLQRKYNLDLNTSLRLIKEKDSAREKYFKNLFEKDWKDPYLYHLIINLSFYFEEEVYQIIVKSIEKPIKSIQPLQEKLPLFPGIKFANKSEEEFAKILTFYGISWEYESRTFPLEWDNEGQVIEAFTPDFYLPEFDIYVELTVQKPKLMSEKIRKIRKLKEIYPNINIKLLYGDKYIKILEKFGITKVK